MIKQPRSQSPSRSLASRGRVRDEILADRRVVEDVVAAVHA
ncbi:hypothetical protein [Streptomyces sp. NPDC003710]